MLLDAMPSAAFPLISTARSSTFFPGALGSSRTGRCVNRPGAEDALVTASTLTAIRDEVAATMPLAAHEEIRRRAFQVTLARLGTPDMALAKRIYHQYMADRFRLCRPFADEAVPNRGLPRRPAKALWAGDHSNGNSYPERCGLRGVFAWTILSQETGSRKPEKEVFIQAAVRAGYAPEKIVHVGDDPDEDVYGALQAGLRAIWLNCDARPWPHGALPCPAAHTLAELPALLKAG